MTSPYHAGPPLKLGCGPSTSIREEVWRLLVGFGRILLQAIIPFNPQVEEPEDPPASASNVSDKQLAQCRAMYDATETTRANLETKARATFAFLAFLAPFLGSVTIYILGLTTTRSTLHQVVIGMLLLAAVLMLLSLMSVMRAVSVQYRAEPFIEAVIDVQNNQFRVYDPTFEARGLLYCASVNAAMNSHIAQFVRGAHILSGITIIIFISVLASIGTVFAEERSARKTQNVTGAIRIESKGIDQIREELARFRTFETIDRNRLLRAIDQLESRITLLENDETNTECNVVEADQISCKPKQQMTVD